MGLPTLKSPTEVCVLALTGGWQTWPNKVLINIRIYNMLSFIFKVNHQESGWTWTTKNRKRTLHNIRIYIAPHTYTKQMKTDDI